jgi:hypothetical protein
MPRSIDPLATQTGFGFAAFLIQLTLIDKLADQGALTYDQIKEIFDHALLNAETHQTGSPSPDMVAVARKVIEMTSTVVEAKRSQRQRPPR